MRKIPQHQLSSENLSSHDEVDQGYFLVQGYFLSSSQLLLGLVLVPHFFQCKSFISLRVIHTTGLLSRIHSCLPLTGPILHMGYPRQKEEMWASISVSDECSERCNARRNCLLLFLDKNKYVCSAWEVNSALSIHVVLIQPFSLRTGKLFGERHISC